MYCRYTQKNCQYRKGDSACARTFTDHPKSYPFCIGIPNEKFDILQQKIKKRANGREA